MTARYFKSTLLYALVCMFSYMVGPTCAPVLQENLCTTCMTVLNVQTSIICCVSVFVVFGIHKSLFHASRCSSGLQCFTTVHRGQWFVVVGGRTVVFLIFLVECGLLFGFLFGFLFLLVVHRFHRGFGVLQHGLAPRGKVVVVPRQLVLLAVRRKHVHQ